MDVHVARYMVSIFTSVMLMARLARRCGKSGSKEQAESTRRVSFTARYSMVLFNSHTLGFDAAPAAGAYADAITRVIPDVYALPPRPSVFCRRQRELSAPQSPGAVVRYVSCRHMPAVGMIYNKIAGGRWVAGPPA